MTALDSLRGIVVIDEIQQRPDLFQTRVHAASPGVSEFASTARINRLQAFVTDLPRNLRTRDSL